VRATNITEFHPIHRCRQDSVD